MKTKYIILTVFLLIATVVMAQPLPPTSPSGNPVPVEGLLGLMLLSMAGLGIRRLKKRNKNG